MDADNIRGMLWGVAVGDALGTPHEFRYGTPLSEYTGSLEHPVYRVSRFQGKKEGVVGQISDDAEMAIALARSLVQHKGFDRGSVVGSYMKWANSKCPFMGRNTRKLFQGVKTLRGYEGRLAKLEGPPSQSNGCLMRCSPLSVLGRNATEGARRDCILTNPAPECVESCQVYVEAIRELAAGKPPADVARNAVVRAKLPALRAVLKHAAEELKEDRDVTGKSKGWVFHAMWCAFRGLAVYDREGAYEDTVDWVIRLGGDTDTNAAIAGALVGASLGYEAMSSETRTGANIETAREADPRGSGMPRPPEYHAAAIDGLARALAEL